MCMSLTKLQTIHTHRLLCISVTNCLQVDIITEEYIILILQIYIYNVRNMYNSSFKSNNVDTVYSTMLACSLLKFNGMTLFTVHVVI